MFISFAAALCRHPGLILVYLAMGICLAIAAGMSVRQAYVRLRPLFWFLVMIWLFLPTTFGGEVIYQYGIVKISRPGILISLQITLKSIAILLIFSALIATMPMAALGLGCIS